MMFDPDVLGMMLTTALSSAGFWALLRSQRAVARARIEQMRRATELLDRHGVALDAFLADRASPQDLKRVLIDLSDAMADRETAKKLFDWIAVPPGRPDNPSPEVAAMVDALYDLRQRHAELFQNFVEAAWCAVVAGALRWSDRNTLALQAPVTPEREVSVAYTATQLRPGGAFSFKEPAPATA